MYRNARSQLKVSLFSYIAKPAMFGSQFLKLELLSKNDVTFVIQAEEHNCTRTHKPFWADLPLYGVYKLYKPRKSNQPLKAVPVLWVNILVKVAG
jgi:hypothetical protein